MKRQNNFYLLVSLCFWLLFPVHQADAFALLGPYESWMQTTNGLKQYRTLYTYGRAPKPVDIGGPMEIGNAYRWNIPTITYGFDKSFLDYFGTNGVAAVQGAVEILNELPPATSLALSNYQNETFGLNDLALSEYLEDLKAKTLAALLEQLGLAQPSRYIFVIKNLSPDLLQNPSPPYSESWMWDSWAIPDFIVERNYDPTTLLPSHYINSTLFAADLTSTFDGNYTLEPFPPDPTASKVSAVAEGEIYLGMYFTGLTKDDVGGLKYLLSTNNVHFETVLPNTVGVGSNSVSWVNGAWRPRVDKITFVLHPKDISSNLFLPTTNIFTDRYYTNGELRVQSLARTIALPDILFSAKDLPQTFNSYPQIQRTGTAGWINNANLNGNPNGAGPGIIQPPISITYNRAGRSFLHFYNQGYEPISADEEQTMLWATFDGTTNLPIVYPASEAATNLTKMHMPFSVGKKIVPLKTQFEWFAGGATGTRYLFQTSTNLIHWETYCSITNDGSVHNFFNNVPADSSRYYRLIPE